MASLCSSSASSGPAISVLTGGWTTPARRGPACSPPSPWWWPARRGWRPPAPPVLSPPRPVTVAAVSPGKSGSQTRGPADTPSQNTHAGTGNDAFFKGNKWFSPKMTQAWKTGMVLKVFTVFLCIIIIIIIILYDQISIPDRSLVKPVSSLATHV